LKARRKCFGFPALKIVSNELGLHVHAFKNKPSIQLLKSLHTLAVPKPLYCKNRSIAVQNGYQCNKQAFFNVQLHTMCAIHKLIIQ